MEASRGLSRFSVRHQALSISFHQLVLQPSVTSRRGWLVLKRSTSVGSFWILVHFHLTLQWALRLFFLGAVALCAHGAVRHPRNRDARVLIAITAPWLLMFALLGQMHERYLVWGAVVSAVAMGVSLRLSIIHFIISAASTAMIVHVMLIDKKLEATLRAIDVLKVFGLCIGLGAGLRGCLLLGCARLADSGFSTRSALKRPRHLRSRWDQSRRKPESAQTHCRNPRIANRSAWND